jgi:hypothetical protein
VRKKPDLPIWLEQFILEDRRFRPEKLKKSDPLRKEYPVNASEEQYILGIRRGFKLAMKLKSRV